MAATGGQEHKCNAGAKPQLASALNAPPGANVSQSIGAAAEASAKRGGGACSAAVAAASSPSPFSCAGSSAILQRMLPNPSLKRTRTGMPLQALISFWAFHVLPARAA